MNIRKKRLQKVHQSTKKHDLAFFALSASNGAVKQACSNAARAHLSQIGGDIAIESPLEFAGTQQCETQD